MDLSTAKREAATRSMETQKDVFVNLLENGEHELAGKAGKQVMLKFHKGAEVPLPTKKVVEAKTAPAPTKTAKAAAPAKKEKEVKKPAPKKVAAKKEVKQKDKVMKKPMKKSSQKVVNREAAKGKPTVMTAKQLRAKVEEGASVFNSKGREIPCTLMAKNEPNKKLTVLVSGAGSKKHYHITRETAE